MYSSGCVFSGIVEGYNIIEIIIIGAIHNMVKLIISEGMGMFGVIATKYENKTNMPLI